jgi:hypothetical protein
VCRQCVDNQQTPHAVGQFLNFIFCKRATVYMPDNPLNYGLSLSRLEQLRPCLV